MPQGLRRLGQNGQIFGKRGITADLKPLIATEPAGSFVHQIPETVKQGSTVSGKIVGLPIEYNQVVLYVNEDFFNNAGLSLPPKDWADLSWNFDAFIQAAQKVVKKSGENWEQVGAQLWGSTGWHNYTLSLIYTNGGSPFNETYTDNNYDKEEVYEVWQWLADWRWKYLITPKPGEKTPERPRGAYLAPHEGMTEAWATAFARQSEVVQDTFKWNAYPLPKGPAGPKSAGHFNWFAMNSATKHPDEAWLLLKHTGGPPGHELYVGRGTSLPVYPETERFFLQQFPHAHKDVILNVRNYVRWVDYFGVSAEMFKVIDEATKPVFEGQRTAAEAGKELKPKINDLLQKEKELYGL